MIPLSEARDPARVGGKAAALGALIRGGFRVPEGVVLPREDFEAFVGPRAAEIDALRAQADPNQPAALKALAQAIQALLADRPIPSPTVEGTVAVRSSAVGEDGAAESFAGQLDSVLDVPPEGGPAGRARYQDLVARVADWGAAREELPQSLIHNDFSPRNATIRGGALCAWDWELACNGLPQRDLVELLCFVGRAQDLPEHLAQHRAVLARCGQDAGQVDAGFSVALAEFLVTRVSLYAMIHRFRRQDFLERVVRTWVALDARHHGAPA